MNSRISSFCLLVLCLLMVGCGAGQNLIQDGPTAVTWADAPIRFMRDTPLLPPRQCPISMLQDVKYLETQEWPWYRADKWFSDEEPNQFFKSCPDERMDPKSEVKLATWEPIGLSWSPSPMRTVGPAVTQALGYVGAAATLGLTMPGTNVIQNQTANPMAGSRFSTGYFNAEPAPSWLGN